MQNEKRKKRKAAKLRRKQQLLQRHVSKCYEELLATTPEIVADFATQMGCEPPRPLERVPQPGCRVSECHTNVLKQVHFHGGRAVWGWHFCLNTADENLWGVDAVFHAVWQNPQGRLIDVTPQSERVLAGQEAGMFRPVPLFCEDKRYFKECEVEDAGNGLLVFRTVREIVPQRQALSMRVPAA